jgi:hypothetical protein
MPSFEAVMRSIFADELAKFEARFEEKLARQVEPPVRLAVYRRCSAAAAAAYERRHPDLMEMSCGTDGRSRLYRAADLDGYFAAHSVREVAPASLDGLARGRAAAAERRAARRRGPRLVGGAE